MITVFCDLGGHVLLGKAREIADEIGDRVSALTSSEDPDQNQKLVYLGADEVLVSSITELGDWVPTISMYITSESSLRAIIFPSESRSNTLMGMIYATIPDKISAYLEEVTALSGDEVGKKFDSSVMIQKRFSSEKTALVSLDKTSISEPFEDTSRFGKIKSLEAVHDGNRYELSFSGLKSPSETLVVLIASGLSESKMQLADRLAEKYKGVVRIMSGIVQTIYGPCVTIDVRSKLRELPEFKKELISISSRKLPVDSISELYAVSPDVDQILKTMAS